MGAEDACLDMLAVSINLLRRGVMLRRRRPVRSAEGRRVGSDPAVGPIEGCDPLHLVGAEFEVEQRDVLEDAFRSGGFGDRHAADLHLPPQNHLRGRLPAGLRDRENNRVVQLLALAQRAPRLGHDAVTGIVGPRGLALEMRVQLDLIHGRCDAGLADQRGNVLGREVRDADRLGPPLLAELDQRLPGLDEQAPLRARPVDQVEVDIREAQALQALVEGAPRLVAPLAIVPELRGEEDLLPRDARIADAAADTGLVAVDGGGIDQAIAGLERPTDEVRRLGIRELPAAVADLRDAASVIEGEGRDGCGREV